MGVVTVAWNANAAPRRYDGHAIVRIEAPQPEEIAALVSAGAVILDDRPGPDSVHLRVPPQAKAMLAATAAVAETLVADVQPGLDAERARLALVGPVTHGASFFDDFRDLAAINAHLDALAAAHPGITEIVSVGTSLEGRPIRGIAIRAGAADGPSLLLTGTMHAREWLSTMTVTCLADTLISEHGADPAITTALDAVGIIVVPVLNPDGYVYSWEAERYWRKNRRDGVGVDLNRNFPFEWGGEGSSGIPEEENYRGTAPASEPEAAALMAFILAQDTLVAHVDYHSYGQLLLYPWGYTSTPTRDAAEFQALAEAQVDAMAAVHGRQYLPLQGSELYLAAGVVDDWAYADAGLMAFVPELRPDFEGPGDFVVDPSNIRGTCEETLAGVLVLAEWASEGLEPPDTTGADDTDTTGQGTESGPTDSTGESTSSNADTTGAVTTSADNSFPGGEAGGPPGDSSEGDGTGGSGGATEDEGCSCTTEPRRGPWLLMLAMLGLLRRRRALTLRQ